MEVEWDVHRGTHQHLKPQKSCSPQKAPVAPQTPLYSLSLFVCCTENGLVEKQPLCGLNGSGSLGKPGMLIAPMMRAHWAGVAPGREARGAWYCFVVPACCLCSEAKGSRQCSWELTVVIQQEGKAPKQSSHGPICGSGEECKQWCSPAHPTWSVPAAPGRLPRFPAFSCCLDAVHSVVSQV